MRTCMHGAGSCNNAIMGLSNAASLVALVVSVISLCSIASSIEVSHDSRAITIDGQRRVLFSGAIHYPRSTPEMWPDLIQKAKEGGLDAIETYIFWNGHEPRRREYNFEGNYDIIRFLKEVQKAGLYVILRIGPYACAEWTYGGFPAWLRQIPGMQMRTNNQPFKDEMQNFTTLIVNMVKKEGLLAPQGGPIIVAQIENEYGNIMGPYREGGKEYVKWSAQLAVSFNISVPWIMCQQDDAPQPMINTCNGFYCTKFVPNNPNSPKMWTENWTGWFKAWGKPTPYRPAEDVAYAVARFIQLNGTFVNYYMYHGGTNFGRTSGGPYLTTAYDYDAPLDEYGNLKEPKWGHLKDLHAAIKLMEKAILKGNIGNSNFGNGVTLTKYFATGVTPGCFISNENSSSNATITFEGAQYYLPPWSVSILPDCKKEVYNTAKVTAQSSIMVKKPSEVAAGTLEWSWRPETMKKTVQGLGGSFSSHELSDQVVIGADQSDYLWYMTSLDVNSSQAATFRVHSKGHVLHAFVNNRRTGSYYAPYGNYNFVFEGNVTLKTGTNHIALLSAAVGLKNYGSFFELEPVGIVGGPVELIGSNASIKFDLSKNLWSYKIGLDGELRKLSLGISKFRTTKPRIHKPLTWYKATFQTPNGSDPVVVDLAGLGKGEAWVNGNSIGRYWPSAMAPKDSCKKCEYRGRYDAGKCESGCGEPSQRWYHVPRSFLKANATNTLVLFEEAGGDPANVSFHTVVAGTVCASADEGKNVTLSCRGGGRAISKIDFASFGDPMGECGAFTKGGCESSQALDAVTKACVGKQSCSIEIGEALLGQSSCGAGATRRLAVQATC